MRVDNCCIRFKGYARCIKCSYQNKIINIKKKIIGEGKNQSALYRRQKVTTFVHIRRTFERSMGIYLSRMRSRASRIPSSQSPTPKCYTFSPSTIGAYLIVAVRELQYNHQSQEHEAKTITAPTDTCSNHQDKNTNNKALKFRITG